MIRLMIKRCVRRARWALPAAVVLATMIIWAPPFIFSQPDEVLIHNRIEGLQKSRPGVDFPHELHTEAHDCLECHHDYQDGENVLEEDELDEDGAASCRACHDSSASIDLKTAYHRQCIKCHRGLNKQPDNDLPITCGDCHPKK
ncbi:MAG: cytochrome c3 family protein [Desulfobacterales bacterium]|nr:cytochrome c3 family protein [Desulfobacterales bacterium]